MLTAFSFLRKYFHAHYSLYALVGISFCLLLLDIPVQAQTTAGSLEDLRGMPLVQLGDLTYQGAFRFPDGDLGGPKWHGFSYGGSVITYNPDNDSLFAVGHIQDQLTAEIKPPAQLGLGTTYESLPAATALQDLHDLFEGRISSINSDPNAKYTGGLLVYKNKLYSSAYSYYDAAATQVLSHFVSGLDLKIQGDLKGPYKVGNVGAGFVSGYMGMIPERWQGLFGGPALTGNAALAIISRTSLGPSVHVFNPEDLGTAASGINATPLVYYDITHPTLGTWDSTGKEYNGATNINGVVFPEGTRSVLFFGGQGIGPFCYGTGAQCADPTEASKGTHSYPYVYKVWAYDALDLLDVKNGVKKPWEILPYGSWNTDSLFPVKTGKAVAGGIGYDPNHNRIYFSRPFAGPGGTAVVSVLSVNVAGGLSSSPIPLPSTPVPPVTPGSNQLPTISLDSTSDIITVSPGDTLTLTVTASDVNSKSLLLSIINLAELLPGALFE